MVQLRDRVVRAVEIALDHAGRDAVGAERMLDPRPVEDASREVVEAMADDAMNAPFGAQG